MRLLIVPCLLVTSWPSSVFSLVSIWVKMSTAGGHMVPPPGRLVVCAANFGITTAPCGCDIAVLYSCMRNGSAIRFRFW